MREFQFIGELPEGYEYKLFQTGNDLKIVGVAHDKAPIAFMLKNEHILRKITLEPEYENINRV